MSKHPVLGGLAIAIALSVILAFVLPYTKQEAPWALMIIAVLFVFIWFFAWVFITAYAWWRGLIKGEASNGRPTD